VTESRVSQIHSLALVRLRMHLQESLQARSMVTPETNGTQAVPSIP